ncbi:MAG: SURF1 family protein [Wenzhouxiangella sp.]
MTSSWRKSLIRIVPHLAAILVLSLCVRLSLWQLERAGEKQALIDQWETAAAGALGDFEHLEQFSRASGSGRFDVERHVLLDNQTRHHHPGVHVFTPFELDSGDVIMVNRGWQPWDRRSGAFPEFPTPPDALSIEGRVSGPPRVGLQLGSALPLERASWPNLMTYYDTELISEALGVPIADRVLLLDPEHPAHLSGDAWPTVNMGPQQHIGYAVQWAAIGSTVLVLWIVLTYRSLRRQPEGHA